MDAKQLIAMELDQIRAATQLLVGAVERLAATIDYHDNQPPPEANGSVVPIGQFPKPPSPPRMPMAFVDDNVAIDEDLRFRVLSFADHDPVV